MNLKYLIRNTTAIIKAKINVNPKIQPILNSTMLIPGIYTNRQSTEGVKLSIGSPSYANSKYYGKDTSNSVMIKMSCK